MRQELERKLNRELFTYTIPGLSGEFFENIENYQSFSSSFQDLVKSMLTPHWITRQQGIWFQVLSETQKLLRQGWKIHIAATSVTAEETLKRVVPICIAEEVSFKFLVDSFILDFTNSKNYNRASSGKFMTIYPSSDDHFKTLIEMLYQKTPGFEGPYILSDKRYKDSKVVFYRYGGFSRKSTSNIYGEKIFLITSSDGKFIPDQRKPFFILPPRIQDPFDSNGSNHEGAVTLNNRYLVKDAIDFSNSGGVYRAEDLGTQRLVIIKEARSYINITAKYNFDAIATLKHEHRILKLLEHTGFVPKVIDFFYQWEHAYLVLELIDGIPLRNYRAREDVALLLKDKLTEQSVREFCGIINHIARNLLEAIQRFHKDGIIVGDLSPSNVIINPESLTIKIVDFEGAYISGEEFSLFQARATTGFFSPERQISDKPSFKDDFYSLGALIYSFIIPIHGFFQLHPDAKDPFLSELSHDLGLPSYVRELIWNLMDGNFDQAISLLENNRDIQNVPVRFVKKNVKPRLNEIKKVLTGISNYLIHTIEVSRNDRLWPADYRIFQTNPLSLAYGALGTTLFLKEFLGNLPDNIGEWILAHKVDNEKYPPGLYIGLSGMAWVLAEIGFLEKAKEYMKEAYESSLMYNTPDIFFGASGLGLSSLYFWHKAKEECFLNAARAVGEFLIEQASSTEDRYFWHSSAKPIGYAHGGSGIALFLLYLFRATHEEQFLSLIHI